MCFCVQFFHGADGQKKYTIRRDLFPCWPCVSKCATCGVCFACLADCLSYFANYNYISIREELRGVGPNAPIKGYIHTVDRIEILGCEQACPPARVRCARAANVAESLTASRKITNAEGLTPRSTQVLPNPSSCALQRRAHRRA